jgi:hypothetical protein
VVSRLRLPRFPDAGAIVFVRRVEAGGVSLQRRYALGGLFVEAASLLSAELNLPPLGAVADNSDAGLGADPSAGSGDGSDGRE